MPAAELGTRTIYAAIQFWQRARNFVTVCKNLINEYDLIFIFLIVSLL